MHLSKTLNIQEMQDIAGYKAEQLALKISIAKLHAEVWRITSSKSTENKHIAIFPGENNHY